MYKRFVIFAKIYNAVYFLLKIRLANNLYSNTHTCVSYFDKGFIGQSFCFLKTLLSLVLPIKTARDGYTRLLYKEVMVPRAFGVYV